MIDLKDQLIKLGSKRKDLRPHIRPVIDALTSGQNKSAYKMPDRGAIRDLRGMLEGLTDSLEGEGNSGARDLAEAQKHLHKAYKAVEYAYQKNEGWPSGDALSSLLVAMQDLVGK